MDRCYEYDLFSLICFILNSGATLEPFDPVMWSTVRKSQDASRIDNDRYLPMIYKLPVPSDGRYFVALLYLDNDYATPFSVEFGRVLFQITLFPLLISFYILHPSGSSLILMD